MSNEEIVLTVFWAYNVDENMDKETDDGAINNSECHGVWRNLLSSH